MLRTPRHTLFDYSTVEEKPQKIQPNGFAKLARFAFRNAILVLVAWAVIAGTAVFLVSQKITTTVQLPIAFDANSLPTENLKLLNKNFPHLQSLVTITLNNKNPDILKQARDAFVSVLENQKDLFELVFAPGTGEYYDNHAMLYHSKEEIKARVAYALSLRPLFSAIAQAPSADSLSTLVGEVSVAIKRGRDPQGLDDLFRQSASSLQALMQGTKQPVDWTAIAGLNVDPSPTSALLLILPNPGQDEKALAFLKQNLNALGKHTATRATLGQSSSQNVRKQISLIAPSLILQAAAMAALLTVLCLASVLGRANLVAMIALPVIAGLNISILSAAFIMPSNVTALWPIYAGVGFAALIMTARFAFAAVEAMAESRSAEIAVMLAAQKQGSGLLWQAAINIAVWAGFLMLWGQSEAAITAIAAIGISATLCANFTLIPAFANLFGSTLNWQAQAWISPLYAGLFGNRLWYLTRSLLTLTVLVAATAGLYFAPHALEGINFQTKSNPPVNILVRSAEEAQNSLLKLKTIPEASAVRWLGAFLPQDAEAKQLSLAPLKDQFPHIGSLSAQTSDDLRDQIAALQDSLTEIASLPTTRPQLRDAADEFRRSLALLSGTSNNAEIIEVENRLFGGFNALADRANFLAALEKPELKSLDPRLKSLFLSPDNIYRLEITPLPGVSNAQLAEILFKNNLPVAHPSLVAGLQEQGLIKIIAVVGTAACVLGLVLLSLSLAEGAGIVSASLTVVILLSLFGGAIGLMKIKLQPELLFTGFTLLALLFSIIATTFLKAEISKQGSPGALHAVEAWLPAIMTLTCAVPIFLLGVETAKPAAINFIVGSALITATIGFILRPLTMFFRRATEREI